MPAPSICPHCGSAVPPQAQACPACGSDEETGWSDNADADRLNIPSDDFDYDRFVEEEFGPSHPSASIRPHGISWFWWAISVFILLALILLWVF